MADRVFNKIKVSIRKGVVHNSVSLTLLVLVVIPGRTAWNFRKILHRRLCRLSTHACKTGKFSVQVEDNGEPRGSTGQGDSGDCPVRGHIMSGLVYRKFQTG